MDCIICGSKNIIELGEENILDYKCEDCGHQFSDYQPSNKAIALRTVFLLFLFAMAFVSSIITAETPILPVLWFATFVFGLYLLTKL